jgi:hypothetical protein
VHPRLNLSRLDATEGIDKAFVARVQRMDGAHLVSITLTSKTLGVKSDTAMRLIRMEMRIWHCGSAPWYVFNKATLTGRHVCEQLAGNYAGLEQSTLNKAAIL